MSMLKAKSLRNESQEELKEKERVLRQEIFALRSESDRSSQKPHLIGAKRKEIARILTVLSEHQRAARGQEKL